MTMLSMPNEAADFRSLEDAEFPGVAWEPAPAAERRLRVDELFYWSHHRGAWQEAMYALRAHLHSEHGTRFLCSADDYIGRGHTLREPWVGFLHQVPRSSASSFPCLNRLMRTPEWNASIEHCVGLWVLCEYSRHYLRIHRIPVPVDVLLHPAGAPELQFDFATFRTTAPRVVLSVGHHQRRHESICKLSALGFQKLVLVCREKFRRKLQILTQDTNIQLSNRVTDSQYDNFLSRSVVFLDLIEAAAVNTVVECIVRGTPLLINRHPAIIEYLGADYPFFYSSLDEASRKLNDDNLICDTSEYLLAMPHRLEFRVESFVAALKHSSIYRNLPKPADGSPPNGEDT